MEGAASATGAAPRAGSPAADRWLLVCTVVGVFLFCLVVQRAELGSYDGKMMVSVTRNLLHHGSLRTSGDFLGTSTPYASYGIGTSLLLVPFVLLQDWLAPDRATWLTLMNPLVIAATAGILLRLGIELKWRRTVAVFVAVSFALLTMMLWQSTEVLSEPGVSFAIALCLLGLVRLQSNKSGAAALVGVGVAIAILYRSDSILLVGVVLLLVPLFVPLRTLLRSPALLCELLIPVAVALAWVAYFNWLRYGSVTQFGYPGIGFNYPLGEGLQLIVASGGTGFFVYNPLLLLAIPGMYLLARRNSALAVTVAALTVLRVIAVAKWAYPDGGIAWGPRLLAPLCVVLSVPFGEFVQWVISERGIRRIAGTTLIGVLALAASVASFASVWVAYENAWIIATRPNVDEPAGAVLARANAYRFSFRHSHVIANLRMLDHGAAFPLRHWRGGPHLIGVVSLVGSVALLVAAFVLAARRPRRRGPPATDPPATKEPAVLNAAS
jgi:4-amino-4-deoxy-L-arabinose transferase-like glycosyltransferase